ncbi:MAG: type IX secretion system membrane protein PorP/SprF [Saprospiraceae bacterium]|nr:type IX secretion system membrane protein PorP/SprF [Saprospiraceae bacterium]
MKTLMIIISIFTVFRINAQDPSYQNFAQNRFLFNPSLTGSYGAQSWKLRSKMQWNNDGGNGYKTMRLLFEETIPCSILYICVKVNYN